LAILACAPQSAVAADRVVLCEEFTRIGCSYCVYAGHALDDMCDDYPDSFACIEYHIGDSYATSFGDSRANFYAVTGTPTAWFDGVYECVGAYTNDAQQYDWYVGRYSARRTMAANVIIDLYGEQISGQTYELTAVFTLEPDASPKTLRMHMVEVLDHYPASPTYERNTFRQRTLNADVDLVPGESVTVVREITFDADSWAQQDDITIICWLRNNYAAAPDEVHQAAIMHWPFPPPPADHEIGDLNCDGAVDLFDIDPFVIALTSASHEPAFDDYDAAYPDCDPMLADVDESGVVDLFDVDPFVSVLAP